MKRIRDLNLRLGFIFLLLLLASIGLIGIIQIQQQDKTVQHLGRYNLIMQEAILQMRIANSLWAAGLRNFVFWRTAKVLESLPAALDYSQIQTQAAEKFSRYLAIYSSFAESAQQKEWVKRLEDSEAKLLAMGNQIIELLSKSDKNTQAATNLLMAFENRLYKIDDFLNNSLGKDNLNEVAILLIQTNTYKNRAILLLTVCSFLSILTGGAIAFFVSRTRKLEEQKRGILLQQLMKIEEDERRNLSFQIHNEMGQDLSALKIHLGLIEEKIPKSILLSFSQNINQAKGLIANLIEKSHNIAYFLRPSSLDEVGIVATIEALILQYRHATNINFNFQKPKLELKFPDRFNLLLYRIVQEALTNIVKYAKAGNVKITIQRKARVVELGIVDDGVGFDYHRLLKEPPKGKLGLLGLRERIELFGGTMHINTLPGKGTRIIVQLSC